MGYIEEAYRKTIEYVERLSAIRDEGLVNEEGLQPAYDKVLSELTEYLNRFTAHERLDILLRSFNDSIDGKL